MGGSCEGYGMGDATVERVAQAIREAISGQWIHLGDAAERAIAAHKAALAEAGYVIVKRQPTDEMLMAGHLSGEWDRNCVEGEEATPAKCWRAMIEAHNP